jgi:hypothetical protein
MQEVADRNKDDHVAGIAQMVFAEAMRSGTNVPGDAWREKQPKNRSADKLSPQDIATVGKTMERVKNDRDARERKNPTEGHRC